MTHWLIVEKLAHWEWDASHGFKRLGLRRSGSASTKQLCAGDRLLVYVSSRISAFSDIRRVLSEEIAEAEPVDDYTRIFPFFIQTEPVLTLPPDCWVKVTSIIDRISEIKTPWNWQIMFRSTLHQLLDNDAKEIIAAMEKSAQEAGISSSKRESS